ncbi:MAG TPA: TonB C-terminal domain-containing protein [Candidatus Polarisedimenticolaceae bacterium]|nr:TonB C-terminal domain-containing protein [Candidatus Polarisedimenticolaceae bacterium]
MKRALALAGVLLAAAAAPHPHLNVYFPKGFDDPAWQKAAFDRVLKNWKPAGLPKPGTKTVLIAIIGRDGKMTGAREHLLSGTPAWDKAAADALRLSQPFAPLPASWPQPSAEVHWHFGAE